MKWNRRAFRQKMKYMSDAFIRGEQEVMEEFGDDIIAGYKKIVKNWSSESTPRWFKRVTYNKGTRRYHLHVFKTGTALQTGRFDAIDFGLQRSRRVETNKNGFVTTVPNKVRIGGLKRMYAPRTYIPRHVQRTRKKKGETDREFAQYTKDLIKEYTTYVGPAKQLQAQLGHDTRMPMRPYVPKTTVTGGTGGAGKYLPGDTTPNAERKGVVQAGWRNIPYRYEITLGDIRARNWTIGLHHFLNTGTDSFGTGQIWTGLKPFKNQVRNGYNRGVRYAKARKNIT
jgi:hypothetical protein